MIRRGFADWCVLETFNRVFIPSLSDSVLGSESWLLRCQQWFDLQAVGKNLQGSLLQRCKCEMNANSGSGVYRPVLLKDLTSDFKGLSCPLSSSSPLLYFLAFVYLGCFRASYLSLSSRVHRVCVPDSGFGLLLAA